MIATEREWLSDRRQGIYVTQESAFFLKISCDSHYMSPKFPVKVPTAIAFEVMFRNTKINQTCTADCNRFTSKWSSRHPTYTLTNSYIFTPSQILPCSSNIQHTLMTNSYQQRLEIQLLWMLPVILFLQVNCNFHIHLSVQNFDLHHVSLLLLNKQFWDRYCRLTHIMYTTWSFGLSYFKVRKFSCRCESLYDVVIPCQHRQKINIVALLLTLFLPGISAINTQ